MVAATKITYSNINAHLKWSAEEMNAHLKCHMVNGARIKLESIPTKAAVSVELMQMSTKTCSGSQPNLRQQRRWATQQAGKRMATEARLRSTTKKQTK
jgi:hypothetical protein